MHIFKTGLLSKLTFGASWVVRLEGYRALSWWKYYQLEVIWLERARRVSFFCTKVLSCMHAAGRGFSIFPKAKWLKKGLAGRGLACCGDLHLCAHAVGYAYLIGKSLFRHFAQPRPQISFLFLSSSSRRSVPEGIKLLDQCGRILSRAGVQHSHIPALAYWHTQNLNV